MMGIFGQLGEALWIRKHGRQIVGEFRDKDLCSVEKN